MQIFLTLVIILIILVAGLGKHMDNYYKNKLEDMNNSFGLEETMRQKIIRAVQKKADTAKQKIDASIVSRVASLTLDEVVKILKRK